VSRALGEAQDAHGHWSLPTHRRELIVAALLVKNSPQNRSTFAINLYGTTACSISRRQTDRSSLSREHARASCFSSKLEPASGGLPDGACQSGYCPFAARIIAKAAASSAFSSAYSDTRSAACSSRATSPGAKV
jgi:hypothetical protein